MLVIGITGRIASGKSTVSALFKARGIDVFSADAIARQLTLKGQPAYYQIIKHFGDSIVCEKSGELNRPQLRQIITSNPNEKEWIESLLHPLIRHQLMMAINQSKTAYCMVEIPLLYNRAEFTFINKVLLVEASPELQLTRIMARDHCTKSQATAMISMQKQIDRKYADDVLVNDKDLLSLELKITNLHATYLHGA
jgi:dephospho-CoA kinase